MGADAVVFAGHSVDPYNGKCLRASAGSIFAIPVVSETDAGGAVSALSDAGLRVLATTVDGATSLDDADLAGPTAWLFGPESHGLPAELAAAATDRVRIPMAGGAESLNVAAAAAICLYQSARAARTVTSRREISPSYRPWRYVRRTVTPAQRLLSDNRATTARCQTGVSWSDDEPTADGERHRPSLPAHRVPVRPWTGDGRGTGRRVGLSRVPANRAAVEGRFGRIALGDGARSRDSNPARQLPPRNDDRGRPGTGSLRGCAYCTTTSPRWQRAAGETRA